MEVFVHDKQSVQDFFRSLYGELQENLLSFLDIFSECLAVRLLFVDFIGLFPLLFIPAIRNDM